MRSVAASESQHLDVFEAIILRKPTARYKTINRFWGNRIKSLCLHVKVAISSPDNVHTTSVGGQRLGGRISKNASNRRATTPSVQNPHRQSVLSLPVGSCAASHELSTLRRFVLYICIFYCQLKPKIDNKKRDAISLVGLRRHASAEDS